MTFTAKEERRFVAKRESGPENKCWPWTGSGNGHGYGRMWFRGRLEQAHRIAWLHSGREIPAGLFVLHTCDNRPCCNPRHLWLGTHLDNCLDKEKKGRGNHPTGDRVGTRKHPECRAYGDRNGSRKYRERMPRGEANTSAKLTEEKVREIRVRKARGETFPALAALFGVSSIAIQCVIYGKTWRHVA